LFARRGLRIELSREVVWATIRDKIVMRDLEAAHAPAAMVLGISLGIGSFSVPCLTGLVLNLQGNAITLSNHLWKEGVRDGAGLRELIRSRSGQSLLTFGVAFSCSSHGYLLQTWLRGNGLDPGREVNIVVVPPPQMAANLKAGNLDGYCVGEPWNSVAVIQRAGWIAAASPSIALNHPEKVLLVRADFAASCAEEHERLIAALREACDFCQRAENRDQLVKILATSKYLNTSEDAIRRSLSGPFKFGGEQEDQVTDLHVFAGPEVNEPGPDKAAWVRDSLIRSGVLSGSRQLDQSRLASMFRSDIFHSAVPNAENRSPGLSRSGTPTMSIEL
jgi:ABC-type nitrate/sulfonate/bicarbonate transport system substrate-binding protein